RIGCKYDTVSIARSLVFVPYPLRVTIACCVHILATDRVLFGDCAAASASFRLATESRCSPSRPKIHAVTGTEIDPIFQSFTQKRIPPRRQYPYRDPSPSHHSD